MAHPSSPGDPRSIRVEQGVLGITLLAAFAYGTSWAVPVWTVLLGAAVVFGPRAHVVAAAYGWAHRRARHGGAPAATTVPVDDAAVTVTTVAECGALALATLLFFVGVGGPAWLVALVVAVAGVATTTTGAFPIYELWRRFGR